MQRSLMIRRVRLLIVFSILGLIIGAYGAVIYRYVAMQLNDAVRLNVTGRERMLVQKIVKDLLLLRGGETRGGSIDTALNNFTVSLAAVTDGGMVRDTLDGPPRYITPIHDAGTRRELAAVARRWRTFREQAERYQRTADPRALSYLLANEGALVDSLDRAMLSLQRHTESERRYLGLIAASGILLAIAASVYAFVRQVRELRAAERRLAEMERLLPICSNCKKIRVDNERPEDPRSWLSIESYLQRHNDMTFTHGICPDCMRELYPEMFEKK